MILARTPSEWLKQYLRENGRALTISRQLVLVD